jgi:hypothetical protein
VILLNLQSVVFAKITVNPNTSKIELEFSTKSQMGQGVRQKV